MGCGGSTKKDGAADPTAKEGAAATAGAAPGGFSMAFTKCADDAAILKQIEAIKVGNKENRMAKHFDKAYYDSLATEEEKHGLLMCCKSGAENPDSGMGVYAMQPKDYDRFKPYMEKVIKDYHKINKDVKHESSWKITDLNDPEIPPGGKLDLSAIDESLKVVSMRVRVGRNLAEFPLPGAMTADDRKKMEELLCEKVFSKFPEPPGGTKNYYSLTPGHPNHIDEAKYDELVKKHWMFKNMDKDNYLLSAGIASDWPMGRGCFAIERPDSNSTFIMWVGEEDHLRIMVIKQGCMLDEVFDELNQALDFIEGMGIPFAKSDQFGYVTSCPTNLGTGMRASLHVTVPKLTAGGSDAKAKEICKPLGLSVRGTGGEHTPIVGGVIDVSPSARLMIKEAEIVCNLYKGIKALLEEEKKLA